MSEQTSLPSAIVARSASPSSTARLGNWRLTKHLGDGQWCRVYRARPAEQAEGEEADYAVKVLKGSRATDPIARATLQREAHIGRTVSSPHLIAVLDARLDQSPCFLVLPFLDGATVADHLLHESASAGFAAARAFWIARQIAEGLQKLHDGGWIHGDINPSNVFVSPIGHATLIDLGLARKARSVECRGDCAFVGTLAYTAPEMSATSLNLTEATDVYSLGVVLFEMLSGKLPFVVEDPRDWLGAHLHESPRNLRALCPHLPGKGASLVRRMLAKEPLRRPSVDELISLLIRLEIETLETQAS